jgi:ABC-type transport system involved in cytochrome c biogenesis permease component
MSRLARLYGAPPRHLLALLACFAVTGYVVTRLLDQLPVLMRITIWFVGAAAVWDLVLGPLLAGADRGLRPLERRAGVPLLNHVRVPALLSLLLLVVWSPLILRRSEAAYEAKSGLPVEVYLQRWLAVAAGLFLLSALAYLGARLLARRRGRAAAH